MEGVLTLSFTAAIELSSMVRLGFSVRKYVNVRKLATLSRPQIKVRYDLHVYLSASAHVAGHGGLVPRPGGGRDGDET